LQNCHFIFFLGPDRTGAQEGGGGGPGDQRRRCSGRREARPRHKTDRGDRDEHDGGLTSGGGRRSRPDFAVNRGGLVSAPAARAPVQGGGAAGRAQEAQGGAAGGLGRRRRLGVPFYGAVQGHARLAAAAMAASRMGPTGPAAGPARAGRADRVGPPGSAR
jgi:hypothetical protein